MDNPAVRERERWERLRETKIEEFSASTAEPLPRRLTRRESIAYHAVPRGAACDHLRIRTQTEPERLNSDGTRTHTWTERCAECAHVLRTGSVTDFEETE